MIYHTLLYAYDSSDRINIILTSIIIYLVLYSLILPSMTNMVPFNLLGDKLPMIMIALVFICDLYFLSFPSGLNLKEYMNGNKSNMEDMKNSKNRKHMKHKKNRNKRVRFNIKDNKYYKYPSYVTPQHPNPYRQVPTQDAYQMPYQPYNPMGQLTADQGPPEMIYTNPSGPNYITESDSSEDESVLVSDTSTELSQSDEEF